jgi:hypothetical protein
MSLFPPGPLPDPDEVFAVAGRGSNDDGEEEEGLFRPAPVPRAGVVSEKLELWNSRSSWRSVWPRSPCWQPELRLVCERLRGGVVCRRGNGLHRRRRRRRRSLILTSCRGAQLCGVYLSSVVVQPCCSEAQAVRVLQREAVLEVDRACDSCRGSDGSWTHRLAFGGASDNDTLH